MTNGKSAEVPASTMWHTSYPKAVARSQQHIRDNSRLQRISSKLTLRNVSTVAEVETGIAVATGGATVTLEAYSSGGNIGFHEAACKAMAVCPSQNVSLTNMANLPTAIQSNLPGLSTLESSGFWASALNNLINPTYWSNLLGGLVSVNNISTINPGFAAEFFGTFAFMSVVLFNSRKEIETIVARRELQSKKKEKAKPKPLSAWRHLYTGAKAFFISIPVFATEVSASVFALNAYNPNSLPWVEAPIVALAGIVASLVMYRVWTTPPKPKAAPRPSLRAQRNASPPIMTEKDFADQIARAKAANIDDSRDPVQQQAVDREAWEAALRRANAKRDTAEAESAEQETAAWRARAERVAQEAARAAQESAARRVNKPPQGTPYRTTAPPTGDSTGYERPPSVMVNDMPQNVRDAYITLGVSVTAGKAEVKKAYRELIDLVHPDLQLAVKKTAAEREAKRYNNAYEVIEKWQRW